jgi:hypothetical protein
VRGDASEPGLRETFADGKRELAVYLAAGIVYIAIGVSVPEFLFSWVVAAGYLLLCLVVLPALARRFLQ